MFHALIVFALFPFAIYGFFFAFALVRAFIKPILITTAVVVGLSAIGLSALYYNSHLEREEAKCIPGEGSSLETAVMLPQGVLAAYSEGRMTEAHMEEMECTVHAMIAMVPPGFKLRSSVAPAPVPTPEELIANQAIAARVGAL